MTKIFDAHFHIIDKQFPLIPNNNYVPAEFKISDYNKATRKLNIIGGAIVSGSFHGFGQQYLINSLKKLGENYVGVAQLPFEISDSEILRLDSLNVKGVRFNIKRLDPIDINKIKNLSIRVYDIAGWHSEFYLESSKLDKYYSILSKLPSVSIDHLGLTKKGFKTLLKLVEKGIKIKATGFGRIDFDPVELMKKIVDVNPDSLMFGTDLPSTRAKRAFKVSDVDLIEENFSSEIQNKIFYENALKFYLM